MKYICRNSKEEMNCCEKKFVTDKYIINTLDKK